MTIAGIEPFSNYNARAGTLVNQMKEGKLNQSLEGKLDGFKLWAVKYLPEKK